MYLPDEARYSYLLYLPEGRNIGKAVNDAMKAIESENEELKGVLPQTYTRFENDVLVALLKHFSNIPMDIEGDVFGKIYEYFLGEFAMSEGKKGGEFLLLLPLLNSLWRSSNPFMVESTIPQADQVVCSSRALNLWNGTRKRQAQRSAFSGRKRRQRPYGSAR